MSRRKQSNPKPLLKSECQETSEEMTVERDNKDFSNNELNEEAASTEIDLAEQFSSESLQENSSSPKSSELDLSIKQSPKGNSTENQEPAPPKLRLNVTLASDPALKPNAKDIKIIKDDLQEEITQKTESDEDPLFNLGQIKSPSNPDVSHRIKVFMCHPCGIGFSSLSTLEAHQTYYCSHRKDTEEEGNQNSSSICEKNSSGEPASKSIKTGKQYACSQCSYSADKKVSLNRHMRMHQTSPTLSSNASNGDECSSQQIDRYCSECDIRFSNIKTYRAHKQHYCSSRRTEGQMTPKSESKKSGSVSPQERSKTPVTVNPPQPFLALPTNPILIIPYSLVRTASVLPGPLTSLTMGTSNPDTTCFTFENGTLQPLATAITTQVLAESTTRMQSQISNQTTLLTEKNTRIVNEGLKTNRKEGSSRETVPLDLTVRKSPISKQFPRTDRLPSFTSEEIKLDIETMMEGKENLSIDSGRMTPEQIVCAPSLPNSPSLTPSPKRHVISPRTNVLAISPGPNSVDQSTLRSLLPSDTSLKLSESKSIVTPLLSKQSREIALKMAPASKPCETTNALPSPLLGLPGNPISVVPTIPAVQPQMYVKQGVSKCIECNIVFCKFENFLAHKQHYCSARNQEGTESKITTPPATVNHTETASPPVAYQQLICAACGIKYTSLDNLRAHQTFYCPKGGDFTTQMLGKEKCPKCKIIHEIGQQCPITQGSYKCPVCDVVSPSASENRKHLETHGCVKAFRCSICRYKGNTLRGMRTHIRMHFDKKTSDFNEENYMSCILEEDGIEIASTAPISQEQHLQQQLYNCDICNYSSSYKGNVIRHMKLVHSQQSSSPPSVSPEVGEGIENLTQNGDSKLTKPVESITVKKELSEIMQNKDGPEDVTTYIKSEPEDKREIDTNMSALPCTSPLSAEENSLKIISQKYCQVCDIKFTYMNTYIAHKQFYCKNKRSENEVTNSVQSAVGSSKNKENMETVL